VTLQVDSKSLLEMANMLETANVLSKTFDPFYPFQFDSHAGKNLLLLFICI